MRKLLLSLLALYVCTATGAQSMYWDEYTDITPGIKSTHMNDRSVQGVNTIYDRRGMVLMDATWAIIVTESGDTVKSQSTNHYSYDDNGRLFSISMTDGPDLTTIEYGDHGMYVPISQLSGPSGGEIQSLVSTRLIKGITAINMEYSSGTTIRHEFIPDGNRLIHKYSDVSKTRGKIEKQQIIECNDKGLPYYLSLEKGHIGPVSYQDDGYFDSIPEFHDQTGSDREKICTIRKFAKGTHLTSEWIIDNEDFSFRVCYFYNENGDLVSSRNYRGTEDNNSMHQDYTYEYDSHGNWIKRTNIIDLGSVSISQVMTRDIEYY